LKSSGFNIEDTHLTDIKRIEKLFSPVMVAFAWAYVVGIYVHENIKQIKIKKHGHRAKSLFKYELQTIAAALPNPFAKFDFNVFVFLSCT
ncbi:MAG: IS4 family transposase, partial [Tannerella sp.]|nr:IS4 family transposase [Tannerella sp.]